MGKGLLWISIVVLVIGIILVVLRFVLKNSSNAVKNGLLIAGIVFILAAVVMMVIYFVKRSKANKMMGGYGQYAPPQIPQGYNPQVAAYTQALQAQQAMYGLQNAQAAIMGGQMGQMY